MLEDLDLVLLGQLLEHVGEPLVVERRDDLAAPLGRQLVDHVGGVGRAQVGERGDQVRRRPGRPGGRAGPRRRPTRRRGSAPRRRKPLARLLACATRESTQSRVRACSIATSKTTPSMPVLRTVTLRSSIWPITSVSVERFSKRRMFSSPVVITWPASMLVTRVIGAKICRRPKTSTTRPDHPRLAYVGAAAPPRRRAPCPPGRPGGRTPAARRGGPRRRGSVWCSSGVPAEAWAEGAQPGEHALSWGGLTLAEPSRR